MDSRLPSSFFHGVKVFVVGPQQFWSTILGGSVAPMWFWCQDFIYGKDAVVNDGNVCLLLKIGEVSRPGSKNMEKRGTEIRWTWDSYFQKDDGVNCWWFCCHWLENWFLSFGSNSLMGYDAEMRKAFLSQRHLDWAGLNDEQMSKGYFSIPNDE